MLQQLQQKKNFFYHPSFLESINSSFYYCYSGYAFQSFAIQILEPPSSKSISITIPFIKLLPVILCVVAMYLAVDSSRSFRFFKPGLVEILFANLAGFTNLRGLKQKDCNEKWDYINQRITANAFQIFFNIIKE